MGLTKGLESPHATSLQSDLLVELVIHVQPSPSTIPFLPRQNSPSLLVLHISGEIIHNFTTLH